MVEILQKEDARLRGIARTVETQDVGSEKLRKIVTDMREALYSQDDGVAIAAPQIGVPLRIFMVSKKIFEMQGSRRKLEDDLVCINPTITKLSRQKHEVEEGCLSVRWLYGRVNRALKATLSATDEQGKEFTLGASGLLAQIFQHEMDHLDGILFIDKAIDLEEIPPENTNYTNETE